MSFSHKYFPLCLTAADEDIRLDSPSFKVRDFDISGSPSLRDHSCMFISVQFRVRSSPSVIITFLTNIVGIREVEGLVIGLSEMQKSNRCIEYYGVLKKQNQTNNKNNKATACDKNNKAMIDNIES